MDSDTTSKFPKPDFRRPIGVMNLETKVRSSFDKDKLTIGRAADNVLSVADDTFISGHHAIVYFERQECWIRDLGSQNGTLVNNIAITKPVRVNPGDIVTVGATRLEVV